VLSGNNFSIAARGRLPEIANGCFVEAEHENPLSERRAALEKLDGRDWVEMTRWRTAGFGKRSFNGSFPVMKPEMCQSRSDPVPTFRLLESRLLTCKINGLGGLLLKVRLTVGFGVMFMTAPA